MHGLVFQGHIETECFDFLGNFSGGKSSSRHSRRLEKETSWSKITDYYMASNLAL